MTALPSASALPALLVAAAAACTLAPSAFAQGAARHADSHVHGHAQLVIVLTGKELSVELQSPAVNLLGFEHAASTAAERKTVGDAQAAASKPDALIAPPAAAQCRLVSAKADFGAGHADHAHDNHGHGGHTHRDLSATQTFTCARPERLNRLEATALVTFPGITALDATYLGPSRQASRRLDRSTRTLPLD